MSSINPLTSNMMQSPRARMDSRISAAASAGSISATDQTALSSALDTIDSGLSADRSGGAKPAGDMGSRIDGLIQKQVDSGSLTAAQASELQSFFAQGATASGQSGDAQGTSDATASGPIQAAGGPGGPHGAHHAHGHHSRPPSDDDTDTDSDTATGGTTSTGSTGKQSDALTAFLEQLRDSVSTTTTYGATASTNSSSATGLVLDTNA
ncbi:MAG: hypothetical protein ABW023_02705 [Sphingomonas sp.]